MGQIGEQYMQQREERKRAEDVEAQRQQGFMALRSGRPGLALKLHVTPEEVKAYADSKAKSAADRLASDKFAHERAQPEEGFTLSAGAVRYGPGGEEIASNEAEPNYTLPQLYAKSIETGDAKSAEIYKQAQAEWKNAGTLSAPNTSYNLKKFTLDGKEIYAQEVSVPGNPVRVVYNGEDITERIGEGDRVKVGVAAQEKLVGIEGAIGLSMKLAEQMDPEWLGPITGSAGLWLQQNIPGFDASPTKAAAFANTRQLMNMVVKAITGAQMSEPEAKRILGQIPLFTDKPVFWQAKLEQTVANLKRMKDRTIAIARGEVKPEPDLPDEWNKRFLEEQDAYFRPLETFFGSRGIFGGDESPRGKPQSKSAPVVWVDDGNGNLVQRQ